MIEGMSEGDRVIYYKCCLICVTPKVKLDPIQ
jgi:hypothetical protein